MLGFLFHYFCVTVRFCSLKQKTLVTEMLFHACVFWKEMSTSVSCRMLKCNLNWAVYRKKGEM